MKREKSMLTEIYIDNYKCLINFTTTLDHIALFLVANGAGKAIVIELLAKLRRFLAGDERVGAIFPTGTLTKWQTRTMLKVELKVSSEDLNRKFRANYLFFRGQGD
jgi:predicted ATPase